ncbi:F0F1 ATP synthase subunit I [Erwiniaceae bacterium L1_54_6]|jgi:ATP synthase protein I|uniref:ATP F0F1 synthase subunit I n=1 Tax=Pantoea cypripedii TaxID=55209 RepID=A0A1X1EZY4_PANCY|nr:F0F1 ATP synthase subunit I [Pantoea cypripedii]MBP2195767.1 ATP synthase protein I [Pantoea cypripedii]MDF7661173.1 F0F1 ATP synthase subunit I [Erwiniaceae bacterium L1_54_6]ORM95588.1 ATP F0F1 synthase subunit I [Pantoea cypripedii]QGY31114.1 ATP F0F1 synthase subunit I [Pantoea cypripedii]
MSVSLYSVKLARTVLLFQLVTFVVIGALFALKDVIWGASAIAGGLAAWLPNVLFMFLAWRLQGQTPAKGRVAWSFAFGEVLKVFATIIFLIVALGVFGAVFWPVAITWLSVLVVQIVAPAVINNKG